LNIAATGSTLLQVATSAAELRSRGLELRTGQRLSGHVLLVTGDRVLVSLNGVPVVARSGLQLREGQKLELTVGESDQQTVLLRQVDPSTSGAPPSARAVIRGLSAQDLRAGLVAAGIVPSEEALTVAQALAEHGVPLTPRNIQSVLRGLSGSPATALAEARVLAAARALGLEATPDTVALLSDALAPGGAARLARALADLREALVQADAALADQRPGQPAPAPATESPAALIASREELVAALRAALQATDDPALRDALSQLLLADTITPESLRTLAGQLTRVRTDPLEIHEVAAFGRVLAAMSADLEPALAALAAAVAPGAEPAAPPQRAGPLATTLWNLAEQLANVAEDPVAPAGAADNVLSVLRGVLSSYAGTPAARGAATSTGELASRVASLLDQLVSALGSEDPAGVPRARELLEGTLARLEQGIPGQPGDRLRLLQVALTRAAEYLGPTTGWDPPAVRQLGRELVWVAAELGKPEAASQAREMVAWAVTEVGSALEGLRTAAGTRRSDLLSLFAGRVGSEALAVTAEGLQGQLADLIALDARARELLGLEPGPAPAAPSGDLRSALASALATLSAAIPGVRTPAATALAGETAAPSDAPLPSPLASWLARAGAPEALPAAWDALAGALALAFEEHGLTGLAGQLRAAHTTPTLVPTDVVPALLLTGLNESGEQAAAAIVQGLGAPPGARAIDSLLAAIAASDPEVAAQVESTLATLASAPPSTPAASAVRDLLIGLQNWLSARAARGDGPAAQSSTPVPDAPAARASLFRLVSGLERLRLEMPGAAGPVQDSLASALPALRATLLASVQSSASRAAAIIERLVARPALGSADIAAAVEQTARTSAVSTEHRLLGDAPAAALRGDLRAHLGRVARDATYAAALPAGPDEATSIVTAMANLAAAARSVATAVEAHQLLNAAYVRQEPVPLVAYLQVPVQVGGEQRLAEFKVLRDARRGPREIDPANATVAIRLDTKTLGLVVAVLRTVENAVHVTFTLEKPEYERIVAREAGGLQGGLERAGFRVGGVQTEVRERSGEVFERLGPALPEGSTLSLLA
jgi:hypothetical protein